LELKKSKYNYYKVDKNDLSKILLKYYDTLEKDTLENIQTPITKCCQIEQKFCQLRESKLPNIQFEQPKINQSVYDFKVNNYKIQEKTAIMRKDRSSYNMCMITKNKNGNNNIPYDSGDNDFYWINLQDNETFYIIPEQIFIERQIISTETKKGKKYISFAAKNTWLNEYKFNYNEENVNEIINNYFQNINKITLDFQNINKQFESLKIGSDYLKKKVSCYSTKNELIKTYESVSDAARETGCTHQAISKCCSGKYTNYKTAKGFIWKYYI
jgi:hypothetical protein